MGGVSMEQSAYIRSLPEEPVDSKMLRETERLADDKEKKIFRQAVGQLGWLESMTAPEVGFVFCQLSTAQTKPKMKHFALYRKAVKELKSRESMLRINKINIQ